MLRGSCAAYRLVSRQAGLRIGSLYTPAHHQRRESTTSWAGELAAAGDLELARDRGGIVDDWSDAQFVMALTSAADAAVMVVTGHASRRRRLPGSRVQRRTGRVNTRTWCAGTARAGGLPRLDGRMAHDPQL